MALPLPNLDDRRWADLVEEGQSLIPVYAPEWTDYNLSDPGITVVDLLAWIAEMDVYWINRIPDSNKIKFLALVGVHLEPPRAARTVLGFALKNGILPIPIPATTEFEGNDPFGQLTRFRTLEEVIVGPGELEAIQYTDAKGFHDLTRRWQRGETIELLGPDPRPGAALYFGFDQPLPMNTPISLFFTFWDPAASAQERARIIAEIKAQRETCRPPASLLDCTDVKSGDDMEVNGTEGSVNSPPDQLLTHHSVQTVWEFLTGPNQWQRLDVTAKQVVDETRAFTLNGRVQINLPASIARATLGQAKTELYYVRCRFVAGAYDAPPLLTSIALNGVVVEQAVPVGNLNLTAPGHPDIETEVVGTGNGRPLQQFEVSQKPVQESSFRLYTVENNSWQEWTLCSDLDSSHRADSHFILDATQGVITFGDGENGRVVPAKAQVVVSYRATRAEAGNLAAGKITLLSDSPHNHAVLRTDFDGVKNSLAEITNPLPALDGAAAETLAHAEGRAIERLGATQRAVTLDDCETLAKTTPGVRLARATARANSHPSFPCFQAPGLMTLIILPYLPRDEPMPSAGLERVVSSYLQRRRVVGTRIEVVGPTYVEVTVKAKVQARTGVNTADLQAKVSAALKAFFDPLSGGRAGTGWEFGRAVYRAEVMQVIATVPGVDYLIALDLIVDGGDPQCGNICLPLNGLVDVGQPQIQVAGGGGACVV